MDRKFESAFGYFKGDGKEIIITTPITPRPWGNIISNGDSGMMVSQTGSGNSWRGNAGQNRSTRSFQDLVKENWGKYFYNRELQKKVYWSVTYKSVMHPYDCHSVSHGIGYSIFNHKIEDIRSDLTVIVAPTAPVEIFQLKLSNESNDPNQTTTVVFTLGVTKVVKEHHQELIHRCTAVENFDKAGGAYKDLNKNNRIF